MIQEDKQLLLKDLSARLPYNLRIRTHYGDDIYGDIILHKISGARVNDLYKIENCKPYLRPMSSMTEEEKKEMHEKLSPTGTAIYKEEGISTPLNHYGEWIPYEYMSRIIDYLIAHHFDYRGLIEKGLAIAVTEENNPYED